MGQWGTLLERFWSKVIVGDEDDCWLWIGAASGGKNKARQYGRIATRCTPRRRTEFTLAHRLSWELAHAAPIPFGLFVCHECDNPRCVNPKHLWLGDAWANAQDCEDKGRNILGRKIPKPKTYMWIVVVESPWHGDFERHRRYLKACLADCLRRGESPYASHGLLGDILDDNDPDQRALALSACGAWRRKAERIVVYEDLGVTLGMRDGINDALSRSKPVEYRRLGGEWASEVAA